MATTVQSAPGRRAPHQADVGSGIGPSGCEPEEGGCRTTDGVRSCGRTGLSRLSGSDEYRLVTHRVAWFGGRVGGRRASSPGGAWTAGPSTPKWDGWRALVRAEKGGVTIQTRRGRDVTATFREPELAPLVM